MEQPQIAAVQARQVANASEHSSAPPARCACAPATPAQQPPQPPAAGLGVSPFATAPAAAPIHLGAGQPDVWVAGQPLQSSIQSSGSLEEVWRDIMANHRGTLDFAT